MGLRINTVATETTGFADQLDVYAGRYPVWDPMLVHDGEKWFLYVLTTPEQSNREDFFTRDNFIRGFVSTDLRVWEDIGTVIPSGFFGKRICAGSLIHESGRFYFFCSSTIEQFNSDLLDQRIFLATSSDGKRFEIDETFSLEPDPAQYGTTAYYPDSNTMMYAWRDPYIFKDPLSGKYYVFICAGGERWGTPPRIGVAEADSVRGPYRLLPPAAVSSCGETDREETVPVWEMERVQVIYRNGMYYMIFSVWEHFMDDFWKTKITQNKKGLSGSATVILCSKSVSGPFRFDETATVLDKPPGRNLYGAMIVPSPGHEIPDFVAGWYPDSFKPEVSSDIRVDWENATFKSTSFK